MGLWHIDDDFVGEDDGEEDENTAPIDVERFLTVFAREALDEAMTGNRLTKVQIELVRDLILAELLTRYEVMILHDVAEWLFDD